MMNSMVTRKPMPYPGGYAVSKSALTTATAQLARRVPDPRELLLHGMDVGTSGRELLIAAAQQQGTTVAALAAGIAKSIPLGRIPANVALFLASDEASYVTGATIVADGGVLAGVGAGLPESD